MRIPGVMTIESAIHAGDLETQITDAEGANRWVPARPLPFYSITERWRVAWMVFTGRADALLWSGQ